MHRADEAEVVRLLREHRQVLAEVQAGHRGRDRPKLPAHSFGSLGLHVPEVLVCGSPFEEEEDHRLRLRFALRLSTKQPGQAEAKQPRPTDVEQVAPTQAVAKAPSSCRDAEHCPRTPWLMNQEMI